jgi:hypothetical protein
MPFGRLNAKLTDLTRAGWVLVGLSGLVTVAAIWAEMWYLWPGAHSRPGKKAPFLGVATGVLFYVTGRAVLRWLGLPFAADKVRQPPPGSGAEEGHKGAAE